MTTNKLAVAITALFASIAKANHIQVEQVDKNFTVAPAAEDEADGVSGCAGAGVLAAVCAGCGAVSGAGSCLLQAAKPNTVARLSASSFCGFAVMGFPFCFAVKQRALQPPEGSLKNAAQK